MTATHMPTAHVTTAHVTAAHMTAPAMLELHSDDIARRADPAFRQGHRRGWRRNRRRQQGKRCRGACQSSK
jgi:hypothetical protein